MTEQLKPCICGGKARSLMRDPGPTNNYRKWVECGKCGMRTDEYLTEHCDDTVAINAWNTRPEEDRLRAQIDWLARQCCILDMSPKGYTKEQWIQWSEGAAQEEKP